MLASFYYWTIIWLRKNFRGTKYLSNRFFSFPHSILNGLCFPFLKVEDLCKICDKFYSNFDEYFCEEHNKKIYEWEEKFLSACFQDVKSVSIIAVGAGREIYYLNKMGYKIDAYECNQALRDYGNNFLKNEGIPVHIKHLDRNEIPISDQSFDSFIFGWGVYNHLKGKDNRVSLLKKVKKILNPNGLVVLSYWPHNWGEKYNLKRIYKIAKGVHSIFGGQAIELGDVLSPMYGHYFQAEEVSMELELAGFEAIYQSDEGYGVTIGQMK